MNSQPDINDKGNVYPTWKKVNSPTSSRKDKSSTIAVERGLPETSKRIEESLSRIDTQLDRVIKELTESETRLSHNTSLTAKTPTLLKVLSNKIIEHETKASEAQAKYKNAEQELEDVESKFKNNNKKTLNSYIELASATRQVANIAQEYQNTLKQQEKTYKQNGGRLIEVLRSLTLEIELIENALSSLEDVNQSYERAYDRIESLLSDVSKKSETLHQSLIDKKTALEENHILFLNSYYDKKKNLEANLKNLQTLKSQVERDQRDLNSGLETPKELIENLNNKMVSLEKKVKDRDEEANRIAEKEYTKADHEEKTEAIRILAIEPNSKNAILINETISANLVDAKDEVSKAKDDLNKILLEHKELESKILQAQQLRENFAPNTFQWKESKKNAEPDEIRLSYLAKKMEQAQVTLNEKQNALNKLEHDIAWIRGSVGSIQTNRAIISKLLSENISVTELIHKAEFLGDAAKVDLLKALYDKQTGKQVNEGKGLTEVPFEFIIKLDRKEFDRIISLYYFCKCQRFLPDGQKIDSKIKLEDLKNVKTAFDEIERVKLQDEGDGFVPAKSFQKALLERIRTEYPDPTAGRPYPVIDDLSRAFDGNNGQAALECVNILAQDLLAVETGKPLYEYSTEEEQIFELKKRVPLLATKIFQMLFDDSGEFHSELKKLLDAIPSFNSDASKPSKTAWLQAVLMNTAVYFYEHKADNPQFFDWYLASTVLAEFCNDSIKKPSILEKAILQLEKEGDLSLSSFEEIFKSNTEIQNFYISEQFKRAFLEQPIQNELLNFKPNTVAISPAHQPNKVKFIERRIAILKGSMVELLAAAPRSMTETIAKVESSLPITRPANEQPDTSAAPKSQSKFRLHEAAEAGNIEAVKKLLARGAKIDREDQHQMTPLHVAVKAGQIEIAKLLLTKGATAKLRDGRNLVHTAAQGGQVEMLKELIAQKWKLNARDLQGNNALYYAVMQLEEKQNDPDVSTLETIVFLLEHNVKPDQKTIDIFNKILAPEAVKSIEAAQIKRILQYIFREIKALNESYFAVSGQPYRKQMIENLNQQMVRIEAAVNNQEIKNFTETLKEVSFLLSETKRKVEQDQQAVDTVLGFGVIGKSRLIKGIEAIESSCKLKSLSEKESKAMRKKQQIDFTLSGIEAALVRDKVYLEKHPVFLHAIPYASIAIEQFLQAINKIKSAAFVESSPANMPQQVEALNTIHRLISMLVNYEKKQGSKWITAYEDKKVDYLNDINQKIFEACEALKKADYQRIKTCETEINTLARKANSSTRGCFTFFQPELVMPPQESYMTLTSK